MSAKINRELIWQYDLNIGWFYYYEHFMVAEIKEGVAITFENAKEMLNITKLHFKNTTPFVYLTNRRNSYSFNPTAHFKTAHMFPNLKGYGVVTYDPMNKEIAEMEKSFLNKPVKVFDDLEYAINWVEDLILMD